MGLKIKSKETQNVSTADNSNVAAGGDNSNAQSFKNAGSVQILDAGAIEQAFMFASESLGLGERALSKGQDAFDMALQTTLETSEDERSGGAMRTLYIAGMAIAGIIAATYFLKR